MDVVFIGQKVLQITSRDLEFEYFLHRDPNKPSKYVLQKTLARHFTLTLFYTTLSYHNIFCTCDSVWIVYNKVWCKRRVAGRVVGNALLCHREGGGIEAMGLQNIERGSRSPPGCLLTLLEVRREGPPPPRIWAWNCHYRYATTPYIGHPYAYIEEVFIGSVYNIGAERRKIRLVEDKAKCHHLQKLTSKGTLRQVFICLRTRTPQAHTLPPNAALKYHLNKKSRQNKAAE